MARKKKTQSADQAVMDLPVKEEKKMRFSQSFLKDMADYLSQKLCGLVFEWKWAGETRNETPPSASMALGTYWEFITFGTLPKNGIQPKPELGAKGQQYAPYQKAHQNKGRTLAYFEKMGIEIIGRGEFWKKGDAEGTTDLRVMFTKDIRLEDGSHIKAGTEAIIDAKYSGLIDDKWSRHGWRLHENEAAKAYHGLQAKQYHYLTGLPVFFYVKDPGDNDDAIFFQAVIGEFAIEQHLLHGKSALEKMQLFREIGFTPYPSLSKCHDCVLKDTCKVAKLYPDIQPITIE